MRSASVDHSRLENWRNRVAAALAVVIVAAGAAHAEVRVKGNVKAVRVDASQSNLAEVLSALESAFRLRVNTSTALNREVSGTYAGSLTQILSRILEGYNYFIRWQATEIEVNVIGVQGGRIAAVARPPPPTPAMSLAQAVRRKHR